jgi:hypothetical protein
LADEIDNEEDRIYWKNNEDDIPEELKDSKKLKEKIRKVKERKKRLEKSRKKLEEENKEIKNRKHKPWCKPTLRKNINTTDNDSRLMQMKRKDYGNWYNCQILEENGIIIWNYINNNPADIWTLIPSLEKIKKLFWESLKILLADKWYWSEENYEYLEKQNIDSYIPHERHDKVNIDNYIYNERDDIYTDKEWNTYKFKQYVWNLKWRKRWRPKKWEIMREEDFRSKLYICKQKDEKAKYLQISKNRNLVYKRNDDRLYSKKWKELYKKRTWVERVFGNIKRNLWFERFVLRWIEKVKIEWNLINMVHNLKKIMSFRAV